MSKRYWCADPHFGHSNIIKYCNRPFKDIEHMNERIINECNNRIKPEDTCICVGDFSNRGREKGVEGLRHGYKHYLDQLQGKWILLEGNHDNQNRTKTIGKHLFCSVGKYNVLATHYPVGYSVHNKAFTQYVQSTCDFVICGHVHTKWLYNFFYLKGKESPIVNINIGFDMHKYRPISDEEIIHFYEKTILTELNKQQFITTEDVKESKQLVDEADNMISLE